MRVTKGEVFDVAVDCRPTALPWQVGGRDPLSEQNKRCSISRRALPMALVLSDDAEFCSSAPMSMTPPSEGGIPYDDPTRQCAVAGLRLPPQDQCKG